MWLAGTWITNLLSYCFLCVCVCDIYIYTCLSSVHVYVYVCMHIFFILPYIFTWIFTWMKSWIFQLDDGMVVKEFPWKAQGGISPLIQVSSRIKWCRYHWVLFWLLFQKVVFLAYEYVSNGWVKVNDQSPFIFSQKNDLLQKFPLGLTFSRCDRGVFLNWPPFSRVAEINLAVFWSNPWYWLPSLLHSWMDTPARYFARLCCLVVEVSSSSEFYT